MTPKQAESLRTKLKLSLAKLAQLAGTTERTVWAFLRAEQGRGVKESTAAKIVAALIKEEEAR